MSLISSMCFEDFENINEKISTISKSKSLEEAAQKYMSILYDEMSESIVLTRLFAAIPFNNLPQQNKEFVTNLTRSVGIENLLREDSLIHSLLGTRGEKSEWDQRNQSKGHIGIPLISSKFIDKVPMMSRLLKQLGVGIDWIDSNDTELVKKTVGNLSGLFYVKDAKSEIDNNGQKIIAAQDFVEAFDVKTVFGFGGCYLNSSVFFTTIIFVREFLEEKQVREFMVQTNIFKTATIDLSYENKIFGK